MEEQQVENKGISEEIKRRLILLHEEISYSNFKTWVNAKEYRRGVVVYLYLQKYIDGKNAITARELNLEMHSQSIQTRGNTILSLQAYGLLSKRYQSEGRDLYNIPPFPEELKIIIESIA